MKRVVVTGLGLLTSIGNNTEDTWVNLIETKEKMMSEVETQVKQIVVDHLGIDESKVTPESKFIDDLGADSLDTVELVMAFEEKFGIEIPDDAAETIQTVKNAIDYIESKK